MEEIDFKFSGYKTVYKYKPLKGKSYTTARNTACFDEASFLGDVKKTCEYKVYTAQNKDLCCDSFSNYCPFTLNEIRNHLRQFKDIYNFSYRVRNVKPFTIDGMDVDTEIYIKVYGNWKQHLLVLTWLRYLYEFPYNFALLEATRMQKLDIHRFDSVCNLFMCTLGSHRKFADIHDFMHSGFASKKYLRENAKVLTHVNGLYDGINWINHPTTFDRRDISYTKDWTFDKFLKRLPVYEDIYKSLKK